MSYADFSPTPIVDALTLGTFIAYVSLASTVSSFADKDSNGTRFHRSATRVFAFTFSILLGVWGTMRWERAEDYTAYSAVIIGASFLIAGSFADSFKDPERDGTTERFASTTSALYPALVGLTVAGLVKLIMRKN
jgi:peptidoglycan/LPS O-acetylase OafA/YrhL